jgi:hypothetical protein
MSHKYSKGKKIVPLETDDLPPDDHERHEILKRAQTLIDEANKVI